MWIYLAIAFVCIAVIEMYHYRLIPSVAERMFAVVLYFTFFLVSWLRWENGADWDAYVDAFNSLKTYEEFMQNDWWEPGYKLLALLINGLDLGYTTFLLVLAIVLFGIKIHFFIRAGCWTQFVFVMLCLTLGDMFFLRQNVAAWVVYASIISLVRKNYIWAFAFGVGAFSVHKSSLIVILLALFVFMGFNYGWKRIFVAGLLLSPIVYFFAVPLDLVPERYFVAYLENGYLDSKDSVLSGEVRGWLKGAFYIACVSRALYMAKVAKWVGLPFEGLKEVVISSTVVIALSGLIAGTSGFSEVFLRLAVYVFPFLVVLLSGSLVLTNMRTGCALRPVINLLFVVNLFVMVSSEIDLYFPLRLTEFAHG